ncbi:hypothetical protein [Arenibacter sp. ARW7G5Y1]|uniref:hypothetical protein n=1 Tax=Arenibacter sp. ARW7G5Y1 TaxID=2135619 RepID=UPI000D77110D|nr:hypothetical protein [Arenibacter sp. ARW7G5Y1]PXX24585.1 hypothetical protein C7972_11562 [Arenibacter sp. ARW7G5Y1]|tara:strand:+ start:49752 stop:50519 length:768 start_codon:yes stop_codon:yes gene_type:complete
MKTLKKTLFTSLALTLITFTATAQKEKNQAYYVHEDQVKPNMIQEYDQVSKDFTEASKKHNLQDLSWQVASTDTGRYFNISPIENMAELDKNVMAPLSEKMGEEAFVNLFKRFNECYDKHGDYIIYLNKELTYMPEGINPITEGQNYRKWHFLHVAPGNIQNLKGKLKELKALYTSKGSKEYYRIYHNGFGNMGDYYLAVISAVDAEDYAKKSKENEALLGEEGKKLFDEVFKYVLKYETETGRMHPELAYTPSN